MENNIDIKLKKVKVPILKHEQTTNKLMLDVLIALLPATFFAFYYFGGCAIARFIVSITCAILTETIIFGIMNKPDNSKEKFIDRILSRYNNFSLLNIIVPAITGTLFVMQLPPKINYYVIVCGSIFSIAIGKMVFGGTGKNIFNPAAVGRIFCAISFSKFFANQPKIYSNIDPISGATALSIIDKVGFANTINTYSLLDQFLGFVPGAMGEVCAIALIIGGIYLIIKKVADYKIMLGVILPFMLFSLITGLVVYKQAPFYYMLYQLLSGGILIGAIFFATDPVTAPAGIQARLIYALIIAALPQIIRTFGSYPEGVAFSILLANMTTPLLDKPKWLKNKLSWQFVSIYSISIILLVLLFYFGQGGK